MIRSKNFVMIIGNLGKDPEIRKNENNTKTAIFSVATSEDRKAKEDETKVYTHTEWHRVVAYRKLADMVESCLKKGQKVSVIGKLRSSTWEDKKTGEKKTGWSIEAEDVFIHIREGSGNGDFISGEESSQAGDDDIPF